MSGPARMQGSSAVRHSCATLNPDQPNARSPERAQRPRVFSLTLTYMDVRSCSDAGIIRREALVRAPESRSTERTLSRARSETSRFLLDFDLHGSRHLGHVRSVGSLPSHGKSEVTVVNRSLRSQ